MGELTSARTALAPKRLMNINLGVALVLWSKHSLQLDTSWLLAMAGLHGGRRRASALTLWTLAGVQMEAGAGEECAEWVRNWLITRDIHTQA